MKLKHDDRFNLELLVEGIMRRNRRYGAVYGGADDRVLHNPDQFKKKRTDDLKRSTTPDLSLGIVDSIRSNTRQLLDHTMRYYGINIVKFIDDEDYPIDGSVVYRGHKHPNPFSKGFDSKALDDKVYFTNRPDYAYNVYSVMYNKYSNQIGQSGFNTFQSRLQDPKSVGNSKLDVGFFTIATPKDPNAITWYENFGYEQSFIDDKANTPLGKPISRDKIQQLRDAECVEPASSFKKIRTYLIYGGSMVSFDKLKKHVPELYDQIINSRVVNDDDMRAI